MAAKRARKRKKKRKPKPFRRALMRGLGVVLPPLLTIVILLWVWNTVQTYVLTPLETGVRNAVTWYRVDFCEEPLDQIPSDAQEAVDPNTKAVTSFQHNERVYVKTDSGKWIPETVYEPVTNDPGDQMPSSVEGIYRRWVDITILKRAIVIPVFLCLFILVLYLLGKFLAAGIGRMFWNAFEQIIARLPLVRNVYSSVKQVTDFVFTESEIEYTRVVAVEYPRKGLWSLGFVTGDSMLDIKDAAGEPVMSVLMPTSPMPATGFTITVRKSETVDLNITVDQAFQFIVSCGVVVPDGQQDEIASEISSAIADHTDSHRATDLPRLGDSPAAEESTSN